jgi:hypothetical protein
MPLIGERPMGIDERLGLDVRESKHSGEIAGLLPQEVAGGSGRDAAFAQ